MRKIQAGALFGALLMLSACGGGDATTDETAGMDTASAAAPVAEQPAAPATNIELPEGVTPEMVAQGQQIFNQGICWSCHQQNGVGGPLGPALNDDTWINITEPTMDNLVQVITTGVMQPKEHPGPMPAKGGAPLTDDEVRAVAAYVYTLSHGG